MDIEGITSWDMHALRSIPTPAECAMSVAPFGDRWATSVWSSKEAVAKALGDPLRYDPRRLGSPAPARRCVGPFEREHPAGPGRPSGVALRQALPVVSAVHGDACLA